MLHSHIYTIYTTTVPARIVGGHMCPIACMIANIGCPAHMCARRYASMCACWPQEPGLLGYVQFYIILLVLFREQGGSRLLCRRSDIAHLDLK